MSKPTDAPKALLQNPFTRKLTEEERLSAPVIVDPLAGRERLKSIVKPPPEEEREKLARQIDDEIRARAQRNVRAMLEYAEARNGVVPEWMSEADQAVARDASLPDKEAPIALKASMRILESYKKAETEEKRPLAVNINFFGDVNTQNVYGRKKVES